MLTNKIGSSLLRLVNYRESIYSNTLYLIEPTETRDCVVLSATGLELFRQMWLKPSRIIEEYVGSIDRLA